MINEKESKRISKFLSFVLRHQPEALSISLDREGWTNVSELLSKLKTGERSLTLEELVHIVDTNSKKRFAFNEDRTMIRASQGHSVEIQLGYKAIEPPSLLYHGTAAQHIESILAKGLLRQNRQQVHLSADRATAVEVGQRHGKAVVLEVLSGKMHREGHEFFLSANGVWLTEAVPSRYLNLL